MVWPQLSTKVNNRCCGCSSFQFVYWKPARSKVTKVHLKLFHLQCLWIGHPWTSGQKKKPKTIYCTMFSALCHAKLQTLHGLWPLFYTHISCDLNRQMHSLPLLMLASKSPKYSKNQIQHLSGAQRGAKGGNSILQAVFPRDGKCAGVSQLSQSGLWWLSGYPESFRESYCSVWHVHELLSSRCHVWNANFLLKNTVGSTCLN